MKQVCKLLLIVAVIALGACRNNPADDLSSLFSLTTPGPTATNIPIPERRSAKQVLASLKQGDTRNSKEPSLLAEAPVEFIERDLVRHQWKLTEVPPELADQAKGDKLHWLRLNPNNMGEASIYTAGDNRTISFEWAFNGRIICLKFSDGSQPCALISRGKNKKQAILEKNIDGKRIRTVMVHD